MAAARLALASAALCAVVLLFLPLALGQGTPGDPYYVQNLALERKQAKGPIPLPQNPQDCSFDAFPNTPKTPGPAGPHRCCPGDPLGPCDLFFYGFEKEVPTFSVSQMVSDQPISPPVLLKRNTHFTVEIGHSGPELLYSPNITRYTRPGGFAADLTSVFYFTGAPAKLTLRLTDKIKPQFLANRCIMLPITSAQVTLVTKDLMETKQICNINALDTAGPKCPEKRSCVIFKTSL